MDNKKALEFFSKLVENNNDTGVEKYGHDTTQIDAEFILRYTKPDSFILDIGSGTGLILSKIERYVGHIDAIEPLIEFSKHIVNSQKIKVFNTNIFDYNTILKYDLITLFGFIHYFNEEEAKLIYQNCFKWIDKDGIVLVKNQFGVNEDVTVSGFSKELKLTYHAQYRHIDKEVSILTNLGFVNIEVIDIYPPECNRWDNTHFYAIIACCH